MRQFVRKTGAKPKEAPWLSRLCSALTGHIGHIRRDVQPALICGVEGLNRILDTLFTLLLAYFNGLARHFDPVYECVT